MLFQFLCVLIATQAPQRGIVSEDAPTLQGVEWVQKVEDVTPTIEIGKVNYLFFFQSWCPGCHSHGFPTLKKIKEEFPDVNFIAVQTVFEGFSTNTKERAVADVKSYGLDIPVGHDGTAGKPSPLMRRYRSGGTPWTVIIDKKGVVQFNGFSLSTTQGNEIVTALLSEPEYELLPSTRGGQELVGKTFEEPSFGTFNAPLTLYRWWTDTCPYCEASLPAIDALREKYAHRGLKVVGVYHPKQTTESLTMEQVVDWAKERTFKGQIVIDEDWSQLRKWWLASGKRSATSVSILVDSEGVVRFVHPGPVLFPSDEKQFSQENKEYELLDKSIDYLLPEFKKSKTNE